MILKSKVRRVVNAILIILFLSYGSCFAGDIERAGGGGSPAETDPVTGAITGIVKSNGAGTISAATPMADYMLPFNIYGTGAWANNHVYEVGDQFYALEEGGSTAFYKVHTGFTSDATYNLTGKETASCYAFYIQPAAESDPLSLKPADIGVTVQAQLPGTPIYASDFGTGAGDINTDDIPEGGTHLYERDTGSNTGNETSATIEDIMTAADAVTTPADEDTMSVVVSAVLKKVTWANIKMTLFSSPTILTPAISDSVYEPSGSGDKTPTLAELQRGTISDKSLSGNSDIILYDSDTRFTTRIFVEVGTYTMSLVPPSGECLRMNGTFLDANDEIDLTKVEGDTFILTRRYSGIKSGYVYDLMETGHGTATDGGAGD